MTVGGYGTLLRRIRRWRGNAREFSYCSMLESRSRSRGLGSRCGFWYFLCIVTSLGFMRRSVAVLGIIDCGGLPSCRQRPCNFCHRQHIEAQDFAYRCEGTILAFLFLSFSHSPRATLCHQMHRDKRVAFVCMDDTACFH